MVNSRYEKLTNSTVEAQSVISKRAAILIRITAIVSLVAWLVFLVAVVPDIWPPSLRWGLLLVGVSILLSASVVLVVLRKFAIVPWLILATPIALFLDDLSYFFEWRNPLAWVGPYLEGFASFPVVYQVTFLILIVCSILALIALRQLRAPEQVAAKDLAKEKRKYLLR